MLTRLFSAIGVVILATGATVVLSTAPANASGQFCPGCVAAHSTRTIHGRSASRSGGGHGGKSTPLPCPPNMACGALTVGAAPVQRVPTIDVAYDARNQLQLPAPHVHTSPRLKTFVQIKTGLWVDPADFAHTEAPATVPGQTVTAIAEPKSVTWSMGEGTITCGTAGSPRGTACGYTYQRSSADQPNKKYPISVTVTWDVSWTCQGACDAPGGTFAVPTMSMTANATLAVGEVQTESRPG